MDSVKSLLKEEVVNYDPIKYPFRDLVSKMLGATTELERIHEMYPELQSQGPLSFEKDQSTPYHKAFYSSPLMPDFVELYHRFIKEVIAPVFSFEREIVFQTKPTFRIHLPNNIAVAQKHKDADYNHPDHEINFWLPLTQVRCNNGFFTESEPGKGDFHHIPDMEFGQYFRFNGHQCVHYNEINKTGQTRVSLDFRVIPGSLFKPNTHSTVKSGMTFTIGSYYTPLKLDKD